MNAKPTAQDAYRQNQKDIAALADLVEQELKQHAERATAEPNDWGFVGELGEVKHRLIQALTMLSGISEDTIEESLAEMAEDDAAGQVSAGHTIEIVGGQMAVLDQDGNGCACHDLKSLRMAKRQLRLWQDTYSFPYADALNALSRYFAAR